MAKRPPRADGQPPKTKWSLETRTAALAMYARTDSTLAVQRHLGVPPPTLREWLANEEHAATVANLRLRAHDAVGARMVSTIALGVEEARADLEQGFGVLGPGKAAQIARDLATAHKAIAPPVDLHEKPDDTDLPAPSEGK